MTSPLAQGSSAEAHEESQSRAIDVEVDDFFDDFFEVFADVVVVAAAAVEDGEKPELTSLVTPSGGGLPTWCERALDDEWCWC